MAKKVLTVKEILELIEAVEKDEKKESKEAKKLADVFGIPLDKLLKSSKKDLTKRAEDYAIAPISKKKEPESLLEQITEDAPTDFRSDEDKKTYENDSEYATPENLYASDEYQSQHQGEEESEFKYHTSKEKKKKDQRNF